MECNGVFALQCPSRDGAGSWEQKNTEIQLNLQSNLHKFNRNVSLSNGQNSVGRTVQDAHTHTPW